MYKNLIKRILDIVIAISALPIIAVALICFGPLIYFNDRGPLFYNAERVGKHGKLFKMFKFRTMKVNSPDLRNDDGSTYNGDNDPRVTKIGKLLRKTSIDELPQFLNVLRGDMSIIGPRPNLPSVEYSKLPEIEQMRLNVKPGITGYNQAFFRNSVDTIEKFKNDIFYVNNITFLLDVKIFIYTIVSVIRRENINMS